MKRKDVVTGLHYNRFRYYDPDAGWFISHDPIGLLWGDNHFLYVPNPIEWIDPLGLKREIGITIW
jgi:RHS repeat-associated protein